MGWHAYHMGPDSGWHVIVALGNQAYKIHAHVGPVRDLSLPPSEWVHMAICLVMLCCF